jgi:hypothetical protein
VRAAFRGLRGVSDRGLWHAGPDLTLLGVALGGLVHDPFNFIDVDDACWTATTRATRCSIWCHRAAHALGAADLNVRVANALDRSYRKWGFPVSGRAFTGPPAR